MATKLRVFCVALIYVSCLAPCKADGRHGSKAMAQLRKDLLQNYDRFSRPCTSNSENTTIKVGLSPIKITDLDETESVFRLETFVKMVWTDPALKWDPESYDGIQALHMPPDEVWKPDIAVYQGPGNEAFPMKLSAPVIVYNNGLTLWIPPVSIVTMCGNFNYRNYPLDTQTCQISFGSWTHSGFKIDLELDTAEDSSELHDYHPTWKYEGMTSNRLTKYYKCCPGEPYITANFNITMSRIASEGTISCSLVRNVLLVLVLAMFWVPSTDGGRKILPGLVALIGQIGLLILTTMTSPGVGALPHAVFPLKVTLIFTTTAILIELIVTSIVNLTSDCPPLTALGSMLNSKAIKILVVNSCRLSDRDGITHSTISDPKSGDFKNWPLVATLIDRVSFLIFTIFYVVICAIF